MDRRSFLTALPTALSLVGIKLVEKPIAAAISLPFAQMPFAQMPCGPIIQGPSYRIEFDRIVTPRFTEDVSELHTWKIDIRQ